MNRKSVLILLATSVFLMGAVQFVSGVAIDTVTSDKATYYPGQTGYIIVTVLNDEADSIRVTALTASVSGYYEGGTAYDQTFYTSAILPSEISVGQSKTFRIPLSLPVNIASGYANPVVTVRSERWISQDFRWERVDRITDSSLKLFIGSSTTQNNMTILLGLIAVVVAGAVGFLVYSVYTRRARISQPVTIVPPS